MSRTRVVALSAAGISILGTATIVANAPDAFATVCKVSVKAVQLRRPAQVTAPSGPLAFTGANVTTAIVLAAALLGLGAILVGLARRRSRASAPLIGAMVFVVLVIGGIAVNHSASASPAAATACTPAGKAAPVTKPVTVAATTTATTTATAAGTPTTGTTDSTTGGTPPPQSGGTSTPPAALPEAPLPVAILLAGLVSGGWLLRRRTRHGA